MKVNVGLLICLLGFAAADPTWPSDIDELEEIMFQTTSTRSRKFADTVSPCTNQASGPGRHNAAEWLRTAFHDMSTANTARGVGGLDASLQYELNSGENAGPGFSTTLTFMAPFLTRKSSMSDLIALGVYTSVRACGGPAVPFRAGRVDATGAGAVGVPQPQNAISIFRNQFDRMGFTPQEMIQVTACGHTIGGVHSTEFPDIIPAGTAPNGQLPLDSSVAVFDNRVVTEYLDGTTQNPLVVGRAVGLNKHSDFKVFNSDRNVTMQAMASAAAFNDVCKTVLQKMIDVVPPGVALTAPLEPYQVKPVALQLTLSTQATVIELTGFIRIRTTNMPLSTISGLTIDYKNRNGGSDCGSGTCSFPLTVQGIGRGLDDSFAWYPITRNIPLASGISSFTVTVRRTDGTSTTFDNNGASYPLQDAVFLQRYQSCLLQSSGVTTITAAVRNDRADLPVRAVISYKTTQTNSVVPALNTITLDLTRGPCVGTYTLFSVSTTIPGGRSVEANFDIVNGDRVDLFNKANILGGSCQARPTTNICTTPAVSSVVPSATSSRPPTTSTTTTVASPTPSLYRRQTIGSYNLVSCWSEPSGARALSGATFAYDGMTLESCMGNCTGFDYWGTEYGRECYCGNALQGNSAAAPLAECDMSCSGDRTQYCGGGNRLELYRTTATRTSTTTSAAAGPTRVANVGRFVRVGCQTDATGVRALNDAATAGDDMTLEKCADFCSAFTYFGAEYGRECFCGNALHSSSSPAPLEECSMKCSGNPLQYCGDGNRLELYSASAASSTTLATSTLTSSAVESSVRLSEASSSAVAPSSPAASSSSGSTGASSIAPASSAPVSSTPLSSANPSSIPPSSVSPSSTASPTGPAPVPTVSPFTLVGCQAEATAVPRALAAKSTTSGSMTLATCAAFCSGFRYFGTEYGAECYCGNSLHPSSSAAPLDDCAMPCAGDSSTHCGGPNRLTLYEDPARASTPPREPRQPAFAGDFVWFGCRTEPAGARALSGQERATDDMTNEACATFCEGFAMFGTEYGRECFCGDELHAGAAEAPEADCSMLCSGADDEFCGNGNRLSVVPHYPHEDEKLRATDLEVRRGGNCPNSLQVLQQFLTADGDLPAAPSSKIRTHLVSPLPARDAPATEQIMASFKDEACIDFSHCLFRDGHRTPASCYVLRSAASGSRTIINSNTLPDMTVDEFAAIVGAMTGRIGADPLDASRDASRWWWHFEGRTPSTTLECIRILRRELGGSVRISVEVEKPGREGLRDLAAEADVVFYSKGWAEDCGYTSAEACLLGEKPARASLAFCTWGAVGAACLSASDEACVLCPVRKPEGDIVE
ncbi:hypothetical protein ACHAQA_000854 [Verticillium albo-atrum]